MEWSFKALIILENVPKNRQGVFRLGLLGQESQKQLVKRVPGRLFESGDATRLG